MASLGQLTAGIAHEIKNPLNFINNFAELSAGLTRELRDVTAGKTKSASVSELLEELEFNSERIVLHGRRADAIVRGMLEHSRSSSDDLDATDVNTLADEYLNLAYHGMRARFPGSNVTLERDFGDDVGSADLAPREMGRVLLNLLSNAFDAVRERKSQSERDYEPTVTVRTRRFGDRVEIRIIDNGGGIPAEIREHVFEPFYTTKPTGEGNTGLGLSLSYDIVTAGHRGSLVLETTPGAGTEFVITIPRSVEPGRES
jgi:signal transduction histidine kinase